MPGLSGAEAREADGCLPTARALCCSKGPTGERSPPIPQSQGAGRAPSAASLSRASRSMAHARRRRRIADPEPCSVGRSQAGSEPGRDSAVVAGPRPGLAAARCFRQGLPGRRRHEPSLLFFAIERICRFVAELQRKLRAPRHREPGRNRFPRLAGFRPLSRTHGAGRMKLRHRWAAFSGFKPGRREPRGRGLPGSRRKHPKGNIPQSIGRRLRPAAAKPGMPHRFGETGRNGKSVDGWKCLIASPE